MAVSNVANQTNAASEVMGAAKSEETKKAKNYGRTVGEPKLSEKAEKYYEELKKKYGNMDFVLVSRDMKDAAKANAAKFANPNKMVVLIDEDKIEQMATDEKFRKQYEGVIAGAQNKLPQMQSKLASTGANVKGYGMQVNDGGTTSFFAVLKKSSDAQKTRIEKKHAEKKAEKKAADKKAEKQAKEDRIRDRHKSDKVRDDRDQIEELEDEDTVTITAGSMEELMQKIGDYMQNEKMNSVQTEEEKQVGQHIDFKG